ncbi:glycosyltransferase family 9 protein [Empedobacter brevis]|uniref:Glycosyltransferase family 9 protein n=1 Tax=Empedobacter brevis TaxID=247 RepID=A0AAJ1QE11_9FLAO|nr:glycosyltransferase family 9 protein [Empedobacter brevis]MDM1072348.1 glycosyltransferase family 9 protein [Empedobacter brevis]
MSFKQKINVYRRKIMRGLTGGIGKGSLENINKSESIKIERVLINRPNQRLGNTLLITPLVQEIIQFNPKVKIDLFVKGKVAPIVFENYPQIDQIIELPKKPFKDLASYIKVWLKIKRKKYDLVINVDKQSSSGRLSTSFANSKYKLFGDEFIADTTQENQLHQAQYPVYQFRKFLELFEGKERKEVVPQQNIQLSEREIEKGKKMLEEITENSSKKTIAFFTFATGAKCYNEEWWTEFYNLFYPKYAEEYNLIEILPVENISMLTHKLPEYYSKDVREIASVMFNCEVVIAADSGMMHLSSAAPSKTIGLFKSEDFMQRYKPYGEGNAVVLAKDDNQEGVMEALEKIL